MSITHDYYGYDQDWGDEDPHVDLVAEAAALAEKLRDWECYVQSLGYEGDSIHLLARKAERRYRRRAAAAQPTPEITEHDFDTADDLPF